MRLRKILALVLSLTMTFSLLTVTGAGETVEARGEETEVWEDWNDSDGCRLT